MKDVNQIRCECRHKLGELGFETGVVVFMFEAVAFQPERLLEYVYWYPFIDVFRDFLSGPAPCIQIGWIASHDQDAVAAALKLLGNFQGQDFGASAMLGE